MFVGIRKNVGLVFLPKRKSECPRYVPLFTVLNLTHEIACCNKKRKKKKHTHAQEDAGHCWHATSPSVDGKDEMEYVISRQQILFEQIY